MGGTQAGHSPPPSLASQENRQGVGRGWEIGGGGGSGNPDGFCPSTTASFFRLLLFPIVSAKIHKEEFYDCFSCNLLPLRCRLGIRELNYRERGAARRARVCAVICMGAFLPPPVRVSRVPRSWGQYLRRLWAFP